ncbi:MAG: hypothetical protein K2P89_04840, partial [Lachnospiraceae bacterium]|nr:hypothetical protein [Lachnospiraceae bacterium]
MIYGRQDCAVCILWEHGWYRGFSSLVERYFLQGIFYAHGRPEEKSQRKLTDAYSFYIKRVKEIGDEREVRTDQG